MTTRVNRETAPPKHGIDQRRYLKDDALLCFQSFHQLWDWRGAHLDQAFFKLLNPILSSRRTDLGPEEFLICAWPIHMPRWWRYPTYGVPILWTIIMIILWSIKINLNVLLVLGGLGVLVTIPICIAYNTAWTTTTNFIPKHGV